MEFIADSTEQIYVRPRSDAQSTTLRELDLHAVYVPPMTGLETDEPLLQPPKIDQLLGLGRPGEVLRNLLAEANRNSSAWDALRISIDKLFAYTLLPPDASGPHIRAEYKETADGTIAGHRKRRQRVPAGSDAAYVPEHSPRYRTPPR